MKWDEPAEHNQQTSEELKYRHDRARTPRHTKAELNAVAVAARDGDRRAAAKLQEMMRPFVVKMVRGRDREGGGDGYTRYQSDELKQLVWEAVWFALARFCEEKHQKRGGKSQGCPGIGEPHPSTGRITKFSSYAHFWMRHAVQEWMSKNSRILPLPRVAWAQSLRLEEAFDIEHPYEDITEASDATLAALVIADPKGGGNRTIPHAGAILRAKRNGTEFDPENEMEQVKPTGTTEEDYFEEVHDTDMDAIDTMNQMIEVVHSGDPRAEEEVLAMAYEFVDKHDLPDEVAERMVELAENGGAI